MRLLKAEAGKLWSFYALFAGFALTMLVGAVMNNAGLYWIAIELTTLVSTFLVAFERAAESIEAAWKYIIIVSAGISLALLGTVLFYWSGSFVLGPVYDMTWSALQQSAPKMNPTLVTLAYLLVLIGYGTKVGFAPMHTWLPDAHSESPAPVSAMLSGALLNAAMLGIVRYLAICDAAGVGHFARTVLIALGVLSLLRWRTVHRAPKRHQAADGLFQRRAHGRRCARLRIRRDIRRRRRALPHAEPFTEQVSDVLRRRQRHAQLTARRRFAEIRGVWTHYPVRAACGSRAPSRSPGAPPFGLFLSELSILRGGLAQHLRLGGRRHDRAADRHLRRFPQSFPRNVFRARVASGRPAVGDQRMVRGADVARAAPLLLFGLWWPQACGNTSRDRARSRERARHERYRRLHRIATGAVATAAAARLRKTGGRMQMAYAWYPEPRPP